MAEVAEGLPATTESEPNMTSREKASANITRAKDIINKHLDSGLFGDQGQIAVAYEGTGGDSTPETSFQMQAMRDCIRKIAQTDAEAQEINSFFTQNLKVDAKEGDKTMRYSISEWEAKLETIQNDLSLSEEDRNTKIQQLKQEATCGFLVQKEDTQEQKVQDKSPEDILISGHRKSFEKKLKEAEERGDTPKEQMEKIGETLVMLRLAEETNGEAGIILKHLALKNLEENHGAQGLGDLIDNLGKQAEESINKVCELMESGKAEEFRNAIKEGKLADLITSGKLPKIEGMRELLFGKDFTEEKLKEILELNKKKKEWKNTLLFALLLLALGPVEFMKETVPLK